MASTGDHKVGHLDIHRRSGSVKYAQAALILESLACCFLGFHEHATGRARARKSVGEVSVIPLDILTGATQGENP
jgi:hypothetical protein